jgi:hypothetical protein
VRILPQIYCAVITLLLNQLAFAHESVYVATLSGPQEFPPNNSPGVGSAIVTINFDLVTMRLEVDFSGLLGTVTGSHIHMPTSAPGSGVADGVTPLPTFPGFPAGVTAGAYDHTFNMGDPASYNPLFIDANGGSVSSAFNAFVADLDAGKAYLNVHSNVFIDGEIRGFFLLDPKTDFNHEGVVDGTDLVPWREAFGVNHEGDANDDELTDGADFLLWQRAVGSVAQLPTGAKAVPEPSALSLGYAVSALALLGRRLGHGPKKEPGQAPA